MNQDDIRKLVSKVQQGDQTAFSELYDEYVDRIYAFIRIKAFGSNEVEDILQEVFIKAWNGCPTLKLEDLNFSAWLYKIASNTLNDYYRKKYRDPQVVGLEQAQETVSDSNSTDETNSNINLEILKANLDKLSDEYKQVIELRFFQEFSVKETAQILNKNSVTIRVWQHRAIKELEHLFTDYERLT